MIRFIVKCVDDCGDGYPHETLYTVDAEVPELEIKLQRGGINGAAYERHSLTGCEIIQPPAQKEDGE